MEKQNLLTYINFLLNDLHFHCPWQLKWREDWNGIEIVFQFELDEQINNIQLELDNTIVRDGKVLYEITILFYQKGKTEYVSSNIIKMIPVDRQGGIEMGEVFSVLKYLKQMTSHVRVAWQEFLTENEIDNFEIKWDENAFQSMKVKIIQTNQYNLQKLYFPIVK